VLQRNISGYPISVPSLDLGADVPVGGELEHDELLAGFAPVDADEDDAAPALEQEQADPDPEPEPDPEPQPAPVVAAPATWPPAPAVPPTPVTPIPGGTVTTTAPEA
jgi:hypothetical protein